MVTMRRRYLALIAALGLACGPWLAVAAPMPSPALLSGRVFTADLSEPAAGLRVQAIPEGADAPFAKTATDEAGKFEFTEIPGGEYILLLTSREGEALAATRIAAPPGCQRHVTLALPQLEPGSSPVAPAQSGGGGFAAWISTPLGATISLVVAAVVVSLIGDELTDDDEVFENRPPPATPSE
ncbi:MAG: hypothetical protein JSV80_15465 [Acidobacteriota bacterium]|nr:MAG: hypothetical protein JSV80_15465 [Acidobacteriota bacterium]